MPIWRSSPVDDHADLVGERRRVLEVVRDEQRRELELARAARCSSARTVAFVCASSAESGSSSSSTPGSRASARASATRCRSPPESSPGRASREVRDAEALEVLVAPRAAARTRRSARTVRCGKSAYSWKTSPTRRSVRRQVDAARAVEPDLVAERDPPRLRAGRARRSRAARSSCRRPTARRARPSRSTSSAQLELEGAKRKRRSRRGRALPCESESEGERGGRR